MKQGHRVEWLDRGAEPQCPPNPDYPDGVDVDLSDGLPSCTVMLPYPAKRIGYFVITCAICGSRVGLTTAGRPDDPRSVKMPCRRIGGRT
jgi:hypothetical protein